MIKQGQGIPLAGGASAEVATCGRNPTDLKRVPAEIVAMGRNSAGFDIDVLSKEKISNSIILSTITGNVSKM